MKNTYDNYSKLFKEISDIAKKYHITIMTATQPPRPEYTFDKPAYPKPPIDVIIIDHLNIFENLK